MQLSELIERFLAATTSGFSNETYSAYRRKLNYLVEHVGGGDVDISTIDSQTIESLKIALTSRKKKRRGGKEIEGKLSPFTVYTSLKTVRYLFTWAYDQGLMDHNPMKGVRLPKEPKPKPKAVDRETVIKLLEAAAVTGENWERARNVALILCLCDTGARISGLANVELESLDLGAGILFVIEKGEVERPVFLNPETVHVLKTWLFWRSTLNPLERTIFVNKFGTRMTRGGMYKILERVAAAAHIQQERHNPHGFRHWFAKQAIENGIDLSRLSELMGHSSEAITAAYYTRWTTQELQRAHRQYSPANDLPLIEPQFEPDGQQ